MREPTAVVLEGDRLKVSLKLVIKAVSVLVCLAPMSASFPCHELGNLGLI